MISGSDFIDEAARCGFDFYTSVPCSYLTPLLNAVLGDPRLRHCTASSEGEAMGIAAGAALAGRTPVVMMQNSGLGNAVNPLTSLHHVFRIPALLIVSWRGCPGVPDEPQHALMGGIMHRLLDLMGVAHARFPASPEEIAPALRQARRSMLENRLPFALVVEPGSIRDEALDVAPLVRPPTAQARSCGTAGQALPKRADALRIVKDLAPAAAALVATTGKTGRELFALGDEPRNLYVVGSMGCASAVGLGLALNSERPIVVLDGDGAALMKLGNLSTIGRYRPASLVHVLLDNGIHDSTGGQPTNSGNVDFAAVAAACGYASACRCRGTGAVRQALQDALATDGPHFLHVSLQPGTMKDLPRPGVAPADVGQRFAGHLRAPPAGAAPAG